MAKKDAAAADSESRRTRKSTANPQVQEQQALKQQRPAAQDAAAAAAVDEASRPDSEAAPKPETQQVTTSAAAPGNPADTPVAAQQQVADIEAQQAADEEAREQQLTPTQRIDRIELALGSGAALNVRNFTDMQTTLDKEGIVADAIVRAADIIHDALRDAAEGLPLKERIARVEAALRSGRTLGNLL